MQQATAALILLLAAAPSALTQTPPPVIRSTSTLVLVPALIQSTSGDPIPELRPEDLRLTDNGVEQTISLEHIEHQSLALVVLLQTGASAPRQFPNYTGLAAMLDNLVGTAPHKVSLVTFDSQPEKLWDFTANLNDLAPALKHPEPGNTGAALNDAISYGIDLLEQQSPTARRLLLLISQPHDIGSETSAKSLIERLGKTNITVDTLTFSPEKTWLKDQFTKPRHENPPYQMSPDYPPILHTFDLGTPLGVALNSMRTDTAAEIATLSGGQHLTFTDQHTLEQQLLLLANQIPNAYTLSFHPSSATPGLHQLHIDVIHDGEPLKVAARNTYWSTAQPSGQRLPQ